MISIVGISMPRACRKSNPDILAAISRATTLAVRMRKSHRQRLLLGEIDTANLTLPERTCYRLVESGQHRRDQ
jgi:hypothetical protein